jgi:hypothetical protein
MAGKIIMILLLFYYLLTAAPVTHNGWSDVDSIGTTIGNDTVTKVFGSKWSDWSGAEDAAFLIKVNDTSTARFAKDSIDFIFGVQLGFITTDSTRAKRVIDTAKSIYIDIDTFRISNAGTIRTWRLDNDGLAYTGDGVDTLDVRGFATQIIPMTGARQLPSWAHIIRPYVKGLAGNKKGCPLRLYIQNCRRLFTLVHEQ